MSESTPIFAMPSESLGDCAQAAPAPSAMIDRNNRGTCPPALLYFIVFFL